MSNLDQIAKLAGFSKATVSRVLNKSPHVSRETRSKILKIMQELDYVPNRNAISLSKGQTLQIGIITSTINEIVLAFLNSFVEVAGQYEFQTIIYTSGEDKKKELQAFEDLKRKRIDALVIISCVNDTDLLSTYCKYGPIVSWQRMDHTDIRSVAMDQYEGYMLALKHLIQKGYTRIANAFTAQAASTPTADNEPMRISWSSIIFLYCSIGINLPSITSVMVSRWCAICYSIGTNSHRLFCAPTIMWRLVFSAKHADNC